jgi:hypothetical protein
MSSDNSKSHKNGIIKSTLPLGSVLEVKENRLSFLSMTLRHDNVFATTQLLRRVLKQIPATVILVHTQTWLIPIIHTYLHVI